MHRGWYADSDSYSEDEYFDSHEYESDSDEYSSDDDYDAITRRFMMNEDAYERDYRCYRRDNQTSAPAAPSVVPPTTPCRFFVLGKCRYGSRCTYSHAITTGNDAALAQAAAQVDCPFFLRGNCKYGHWCRLRHATPPRPAAMESRTTQPSTQDNQVSDERTCGICFEDIVESGKRFGLLSCDHCFCVECLREWRQSKDQERDIVRSCPACRTPSNFIVPSLRFCTGEEKTSVINAYKSHLAMRECKYFTGRVGSCPFGPNCFYAHRDEDGRDIKHIDRMPQKRRRRLPHTQWDFLFSLIEDLDMGEPFPGERFVSD